MPAFSVITKEICVVSNHLKELYLEDECRVWRDGGIAGRAVCQIVWDDETVLVFSCFSIQINTKSTRFSQLVSLPFFTYFGDLGQTKVPRPRSITPFSHLPAEPSSFPAQLLQYDRSSRLSHRRCGPPCGRGRMGQRGCA